jgi:hypothetical protein
MFGTDRPLSGRIFAFSMKTQKCDEFIMIDKGIEKEISKMKFESDKVGGQTVYFGLNFCQFIEEFDCFQTSIFGCIDVILSTEYVFPGIWRLWFYPLNILQNLLANEIKL